MQNVDWMDGYPLDCYDYQSTCGAENQQKVGNGFPKLIIKPGDGKWT